jgi:hypothetical protein
MLEVRSYPEYAAPNPADPKVTVCVGTILLAMSTDAHSVSLRDAAFLRSLIIGASEPTLGGNLSGDPGASPSIHLDAKIISVLSTTAVTRPSQIAALVSPRAVSSQVSNACRTSFRRTWAFRMSDACPEKPFLMWVRVTGLASREAFLCRYLACRGTPTFTERAFHRVGCRARAKRRGARVMMHPPICQAESSTQNFTQSDSRPIRGYPRAHPPLNDHVRRERCRG